MRFIFIFLITFFSLNACSPTTNPIDTRYPISNLEGEPSSIIGGCVNVITGDFFDIQRDVVLIGPEPLVLERAYSSSRDYCGSLYNGWNFNFEGRLSFENKPERRHYHYTGPFGSHFTFKGSKNIGKPVPLSNGMFKGGITNTGSGHISAKTNLKNWHCSKEIYDDLYKIRKGDGSELFFHDKELFLETFPSGTKREWTHANKKVNGVLAYNREGQIINSFKFNYLSEKGFKKSRRLCVLCSNGKTINYKFHFFKNDGEGPGEPHLTEVERPNDLKEIYVYERYGFDENYFNRITEKRLPNNRFIKVNYYPNENEGLYDETGELKPISPAWAHRVKTLLGPVGTDAVAHEIYRFNYYFDENYNGCCGVIDAHGVKTDYAWDSCQRLHSILRYTSQKTLYAQDRLYWGKKGTADFSNLLSHTFSSANETLFCRCYQYDNYGNIKVDHLYGNLTGKNTAPLLIGSNGYPIENSCEHHIKYMNYSEDGKQLLIYEKDGLHIKTYSYYPGTDLLAVIYTWDDTRIATRQVFKYDENCALIEESLDDGSQSDISNFSGVTMRKVRYISPRKSYPWGLPEIIQEKVWDQATGDELAVKTVANTYTLEGKLSQQVVYDSAGMPAYSLEWRYDWLGNLTYEKNALGEEIFRDYDGNGNLVMQHGPRGDYHKRFHYDYSNRLTRVDEIHPKQTLSTCYHYDHLGRKTATIDCYGNETKYIYDDFGRLIETIGAPVLNEQAEVIFPRTRRTYDPMGNPAAKIDAKDNAIYAAYTARGQPYAIAYPDGSCERFEYTLQGLLEKTTAKNGCLTVFTRDYQDRIISTEYYSAAGEKLWSTSATYNAFHLLSETDVEGQVTSYTYDAFGRKTAIRRGEGLVSFEYDALGRVEKTITHLDEGATSIKLSTYDLLDRIILERIVDSSGTLLSCEKYAYDAEGKKTQVTNWGEEGPKIQHTLYDSFGIPFKVTDALGNTTVTVSSFNHRNGLGQLVGYQETTDPLGNVTITIKDTLGRDAEIICKNAFGVILQKKVLLHDSVGNLCREIETIYTPDQPERNLVFSWKYDAMQNCTAFTQAEGSQNQQCTHYLYNLFNQLMEVQKPTGVSLFHSYNEKGLLTEYRASDNSFHYSYVYDIKDRPIRINDEIHGTFTSKTFDVQDRLIEARLPTGHLIKYAYDKGGRRSKLILPDDSAVEYSYDSLFLRQIRRLSSSNKVLYTHAYNSFDLSGNPLSETFLGKVGEVSRSYDKNGRLIAYKTEHFEELIPPDGYDAVGCLTQCKRKDSLGESDCKYIYDSLYQLTSETGVDNHTYTNDSIYNRLSKDGTSYQINDLNQILSVGDVAYHYDLDGNLISTGDCHYTYDALNRLIEFKKDQLRVEFRYDADNRRVEKIVHSPKGKLKVHYLFDGNNEMGCYDEKGKLLEFRALGLGMGAEIGAAVAFEIKGTPYAPLYDHQGNVTALVTSSGQLAEMYRYSAFGEEQIFNDRGKRLEKSEVGNFWRFSSKRVDQETGLSFFGRRYYTPTLGRWLTQDPIGYAGGLNFYAYVSNSPLTKIDLYGLLAQSQSMWDRVHDSYDRARTKVTEAVKTVARKVGEKLRSAIRTTGEIIYAIAEHAIPIAVAKDIPRYMGHVLKEGTFKGYTMSFRRTDSHYSYYEGNVNNPNIIIGLVKGQNNNCDSTRQSAAQLSSYFNSIGIECVVNETDGFMADTCKSAGLMIGFENLTVELTVDCLRYIARSPSKCKLIFTSSQGTLAVAAALPYLSIDDQKQLSLYNFGPAKILPKGNLKECVNYISLFDIVPFIADPIGIFRSFFSDDYTVKFLYPHTPFYDHGFDKGPYAEKAAEIGKEYMKSISKSL